MLAQRNTVHRTLRLLARSGQGGAEDAEKDAEQTG
jgi:hypothetical protein